MRRAAGLGAVLLAAVLLAPAAAAQETPPELDLSEAALRLADLPDGFEETADLFTIGGLVTDLLGRAEGAAILGHRVFADRAGTEVVESLLIGPLAPADQEGFDAWFDRADEAARAVAEAVPPFGTSLTRAVLGSRGLGDSSLACRATASEGASEGRPAGSEEAGGAALRAGVPTRLEAALARRGAYLLVVAVTHDGEGEPLADAVALARLLDERLAEALGLPRGGFRPPGLLEPELTTHIPTPGDLSTDPAVVGTNLALAGLAMVAFVAADLMLDATLARSEARLRRALLPPRWLGRLERRLDTVLAAGLRPGRCPHWLRLVGVVTLYGLVFSCLEPGWNPFSVTGLYLFVTMAVSCGVIGQLSGMLKWAAARRYGLPAEVGLRPANLLTAAASLGFSRAFSLYPGLMMGRPVAYRVDEGALDPPRQVRLAGVGAAGLAGLAAAAWVLTIPTSLLRTAQLPGWLEQIVGGGQALLLVTFAVGLQNLFREMLVLPRAAGRHLSRRHRLVWMAALLIVTFTFWHTLINPNGSLAAALGSGQVRFFLAVVGGFVLFALGVRWWAGRPTPAGTTPAPVAPPPPDDAAPEGAIHPEAASPAGWRADPTGRHQHRYWDGSRWTHWVADGGVTGRDPAAAD